MVSFTAIHTTVVDVLGGGVHAHALGDGDAVEVRWKRLRLTGYGRFFNFDHEHLVVELAHHGRPLELMVGGRPPARFMSTDVRCHSDRRGTGRSW